MVKEKLYIVGYMKKLGFLKISLISMTIGGGTGVIISLFLFSLEQVIY